MDITQRDLTDGLIMSHTVGKDEVIRLLRQIFFQLISEFDGERRGLRNLFSIYFFFHEFSDTTELEVMGIGFLFNNKLGQ